MLADPEQNKKLRDVGVTVWLQSNFEITSTVVNNNFYKTLICQKYF